MATKQYHTGSRPRLYASFKLGTVATDPSTVTFKLRAPSGTTTTTVYPDPDPLVTSAIVKDSTGEYHLDISAVTEQGEYWYRVEGTGSVTATAETFFVVKESHF